MAGNIIAVDGVDEERVLEYVVRFTNGAVLGDVSEEVSTVSLIEEAETRGDTDAVMRYFDTMSKRTLEALCGYATFLFMSHPPGQRNRALRRQLTAIVTKQQSRNERRRRDLMRTYERNARVQREVQEVEETAAAMFTDVLSEVMEPPSG